MKTQPYYQVIMLDTSEQKEKKEKKKKKQEEEEENEMLTQELKIHIPSLMSSLFVNGTWSQENLPSDSMTAS
jgi:hypothetical protein